MTSTLTPTGWVVDNDVVDERAPLPRVTQERIDRIHAEIAAGSNNYPTGTSIIRSDDQVVMVMEGVGTAARFGVASAAGLQGALDGKQPLDASLTAVSGSGVYVYGGALTKIVNFMIQRNPDMRGNSLINGMRRSVQPRRSTGLTYEDSLDVNDGDAGGETFPSGFANTTAAALTMEFLSRYVIKYPQFSGQVTPYIKEIGRFLLSMQVMDQSMARFGGFALAINDQTASSFGAGIIGKALLKAWEATGDADYLAACVRAAQFLAVCHSPNEPYDAIYSETPIPVETENMGFKGFCDTIGSTDVISITSTTWNLVAADFLHQLYLVTGTASYETIAMAARDWMDHGVIEGRDYFALKNAAPSSKVSTTWPNNSAHSYADGAWHRAGDAVLPYPTGTVGTDQIEYGLDSLYSLDYDENVLRDLYEYYRDLPSHDTGSAESIVFSPAYNGAICFTGFWRLDWVEYIGPDPQPPKNVAYGSYYDSQGAGTLGYFKQQLAPADFALSLPMLLVVVDRGSLLKADLSTRYSTGIGFTYYTKGVIPIAKAGIALLRCF